jgi:hypothetical protein
MIAPLREMPCEEIDDEPRLSAAARAVAVLLLPSARTDDAAPAVPAWQAWLLVAWLVVTSIAYVAITLRPWTP